MDSLTARVLLVEDSPTDAQLIQYCLRHAHGTRYEVTVAERLDAAMTKLREQKFDVVLLDLGLPDSSGLAGFARVQAEFPRLPVVILTGAGDETTGVEAIRLGSQDYLVKGSADAKSITSAIRYAIERKRAEEALRDNEARLKAITESTPDYISLKDREGRYVIVNSAAAHFLSQSTGMSAAEIIGKKDDAIFPPEVGRPVMEVDRQVMASGEIRAFDQLFHVGGEPRIFSTVKSPCLNDEGIVTGVVSFSRDITERKRMEEELRHLNRTLRAHSNSSKAIMRATNEGEFLKEACRIVLEDCGHAMVWIGFAEQDEARTVRPVAHAGFEEGYLETLRITWSDTERGRGPTGTAIRTGKPAFCRNMLTDPVFAPWRAEALKRGYASSLVLPLRNDGKVFGAVTIYFRDPDPFTEDEVRLLSELADDLAHGIGVVRMREARAEAEKALRELNATLEERVAVRTMEVQERADQLRALATELSQTEQRERNRLAGILHDHIQQLLVAAKLQLALIKRADKKTVESAVLGVEAIIKEAIDASRSLTVELSPPILHQAGLAAGLGWLANRMQEKHLFKVHVQADHDAAPTDESVRFLLFESVRELLLNAVKHSGVQEAQVTMLCTPEGWTKIVVEDKGAGFDAVGVRARQVRDGSFGLFSIQQRLVHLGGRLEIESAPGRGTRVTLLAPSKVAPPDAQRPADIAPAITSPEAAPLRDKNRKIRVLLADDHEIVRQGFASMLRGEADIEVVAEAKDGQKAVELARRHKPDVVVMDVNMPGMDGVEATKIITRELPQSKVIGLSMHLDMDIAAAIQKAGAVGYLTKGGPSEDLITAIRLCALGMSYNLSAAENAPASAATRPVRRRARAGAARNHIRVLVADDQDYLRQLLVEHLRHEADLEVVGQAKDGEEAVRLALAMRPDVVVMDLRMPKMNGIEATRKLTAELPDLRVIGLSAYGESDAETAAIRAEGAVACVLKESSCEELVAAIRTACAN